MRTSYDPTTYLNQQATTAPLSSREASAAERLRSSPLENSDADGEAPFTVPGFVVLELL